MKTTSIERHLARQGFAITRMGDGAPKDSALDTLALLLSFQFPTFQHLLRHMRGNIREKPGFFLPLAGLVQNEMTAIRNICHLLRSNGLLAYYCFDASSGELRGSVATDERALGFLSGGWLERCIGIQVDAFLNLSAHRIEFARNVCVLRPAQSTGVKRTFELDALLAVDETLYWWEAKSGQYTPQHLSRYAAVAKELNLPAAQCLLVLAQPVSGADLKALGAQIGFQVLRPQAIAAKIESIESRHQKRFSSPTSPNNEQILGLIWPGQTNAPINPPT